MSGILSFSCIGYSHLCNCLKVVLPKCSDITTLRKTERVEGERKGEFLNKLKKKILQFAVIKMIKWSDFNMKLRHSLIMTDFRYTVK